MPRSNDEDVWEAIRLVLENAYPGDFGDAELGAYRFVLGDEDPKRVLVALRTNARKGSTFRPSASELAGELLADPGRPTWSEAYRLLFGARGLLTVRPERSAIERAREQHPLLAAFIEAEGYQRLTMLPVNDPDWGERTRRDLERAWDRLEQRADSRRAAGLKLDGGPARRELGPQRPDYLAAFPAPDSEAAT